MHVSRFEVFPKSQKNRHCLKWVLLQSFSKKSLCASLTWSHWNQLKKFSPIYISRSLSRIISDTPPKFSPPPIPFISCTEVAQRIPPALMNVVEPVDHVEEGEDGGEDHPGPLIDGVHIGQVWDVHLKLGGPSP